MNINPFVLERYFARYEFNTRYMLSSSDCQPLTPGALFDMAGPAAREAFNELWLGYTEATGGLLLREKIAQLYSTVKPEDILVAAPAEAILLAMQACLEKGDHVIVAYPSYQSLYQIAQSMGCQVSWWHLDRNGSEWVFDVDELVGLCQPNTKMIVVNFPHNPTGYLPSAKQWQQIIDLARRRGIILFSDEMYQYLEQQPGDRLPAAVDLYERGISLFGMSKTFSLAGIRVGWLALRDREIYQKIATWKDYTTICSSAPSEFLASLALDHRQTIIARNLKIIRDNIEAMNQFCAQRPGLFAWAPPKAGSIAFVPLQASEGMQAWCDRMIECAGVMVLPGSVYGDDRYNDFVRIGLGRTNFAEALAALERALLHS